jgi:hypothetical protein
MNLNKIKDLKLFIAEAKRLKDKSFYQHFHSGEEIGFSDGSLPDDAPTVEQMESYLLHFRKFMQPKDCVCYRHVNENVRELAKGQNVILNEWDELHTTFQEFLKTKALTGRVITYVPEIPDLSILKLFKARTYGDLSHLNSKEQALHQKLSSTNQLDGLYRFEYYNFLSEAGEFIVEMADLCSILLASVDNQI